MFSRSQDKWEYNSCWAYLPFKLDGLRATGPKQLVYSNITCYKKNGRIAETRKRGSTANKVLGVEFYQISHEIVYAFE